MALPAEQVLWKVAIQKSKCFFVVGEFTRLKQSKLCHYIFDFYLRSFYFSHKFFIFHFKF